MSNDITSILETLASAKAAVDQVPVLEGKIKTLEDNLNFAEEYSKAVESSLSVSDSALAAAEARITQLQGEREAYFLRASEAEGKLANVVNLLGAVIPKAEAEPARPTNQPEEFNTKSSSGGDSESVAPEANVCQADSKVTDTAPSEVDPTNTVEAYHASLYDSRNPNPVRAIQPWEVPNVSPTLAATHPDWIRTGAPEVPYTMSKPIQDDDLDMSSFY